MRVISHPAVLARVKAMLAKPFPEPSKDWARRILDDPHATWLQKRMASEALTPRIGRRDRQPGDDDDEG